MALVMGMHRKWLSPMQNWCGFNLYPGCCLGAWSRDIVESYSRMMGDGLLGWRWNWDMPVSRARGLVVKASKVSLVEIALEWTNWCWK
eukprot:2506146-Ditylum_brightwellii.AAC.1